MGNYNVHVWQNGRRMVKYDLHSLLIGGIQLLSLGVIGEYVGKMYLETKKRPRYIIKEKKGVSLDDNNSR